MAETLEKVENNLEIITQKFDNITKDLTKMEKNNIQEIQTNILNSLYQIRKDFLEEIKELNSNGKVGGKSENSEKNEDLLEENRRLKYRITHLVRGIEEIQENKEIEELKKENEKLKYRMKILLRNFEDKL